MVDRPHRWGCGHKAGGDQSGAAALCDITKGLLPALCVFKAQFLKSGASQSNQGFKDVSPLKALSAAAGGRAQDLKGRRPSQPLFLLLVTLRPFILAALI